MNSAVHGPVDYPLCWGTVGWGESDASAYDMGTGGNDGAVLVRVQLFRGRDSSKPLSQTTAQGQRLLAKVHSNLMMLPPVGSRVVVALVQPSPYAPGGSIIVFCDRPNVGKLGGLQPGELGIGGAADKGVLTFKNDGTAHLDAQTIEIGPGGTLGPSQATAVGQAARVGDTVGPYLITRGSTKTSIGG